MARRDALPSVRLLLAWVLLVASGGVGAAPLTLIYSGNLDGELEPCGCTAETDYGGLSRRATYLDGLRADGIDPVVVTSGGLLTAVIGADRIKADFILSGLRLLGYDAIGLQWADLVYGPDFLTAHPLPYVASNWRDGTFPTAQLVTRGALRLRLFAWLDPAGSVHSKMVGGEPEVSDDPAPLATALAAARGRGELTLLSTTLSLDRARATLPLDDVNILLLAAAPEHPGPVQQVGQTLVLTPGTRGMRLGRVDLEVAADGSLQTRETSVVELTDAVADAPRLAAWYAAYNDALRNDYLRQVEERKARAAGTSPFVGSASCTVCHAAATSVWQGSRHAGAMDALEQVGKAFDPNCVGCHSVGFGQEGGFLGLDETPDLANVQCESCHGPGRAHVAVAGQEYPGGRVATEACASCHHPNHSPSFVFDAYWPQIVHGRD